jgi:hypothetical protein
VAALEANARTALGDVRSAALTREAGQTTVEHALDLAQELAS